MMEELVLKYISGQASAQEREQVLLWVTSSEANRAIYIEQKREYIKVHFPNKEASSEDIKEFRRLLKAQINSESVSGFGIDKSGIDNSGADNNSWATEFVKWTTRAAAVLFLPLALFAGYLAFERSSANMGGSSNKERVVSQLTEYVQVDSSAILTYHTNPGVKGMVELPDGSTVILNSSSKIRVPSKFNKESRVVELEGEGYFNVASDSTWPMFVNTARGISVKVLGTTFNLSSYENDSELKFTLISGRVKLLAENGDHEFDVEPLQEVVIPDNRESRGVKRVANVELNTAWKDGYLVFEDTPLDQVVRKLERWYGASINVSNPKILDYRFTATFNSESLSQVLEFLKLSTNIDYSITGINKVNLSQSFL